MDNGPQYNCSEFEEFISEYGIKHVISSPHFPQSNGKGERHVSIVKRTLTKGREDGQDPAMALLCLRTTPLGPGLPSPAELMFKYKVKCNLPSVNRSKFRDEEKIKQAKLSKQAKYDQAYNKGAKQLPDLMAGEFVRVQAIQPFQAMEASQNQGEMC